MPKYKLTENGNIVIKDGHPVVVGDDGKEYTIDAIGAKAKITELNGEAAGHRKNASTLKTAMVPLEGIDDIPAFIATATINAGLVDSMDEKNKADVAKATANLNKTWQEKFDGEVAKSTGLSNDLFEANVKTKFATSKAVARTVLTGNIAYATFKSHFSADGSATDSNGAKILSKEKPSENAGFEESLNYLIDNYPDKDQILKGSGAQGSGSGGSGNGDGQPSNDGKTGRDMIAEGLKERQAA